MGSFAGRSLFVQKKAAEWVDHLTCLSAVTVTGKLPQDAFAAFDQFSKSLSQEWNYLQRAVPHCGPALLAVEKAIAESFLPKLFGCEVSPAEPSMCELPIKLAGLGVVNPSTSAPSAYELSRATPSLIWSMPSPGGKNFIPGSTLGQFKRPARRHGHVAAERESTAQLDHEASASVWGNASQLSLRRAKEFSTGAWLSAMPSARNDAILSAEEF